MKKNQTKQRPRAPINPKWPNCGPVGGKLIAGGPRVGFNVGVEILPFPGVEAGDYMVTDNFQALKA